MAFCEICNRTFKNDQALQQHLRDAPAHALTFDCDESDRKFPSDDALQQHLRDAPAHTVRFNCDDCGRTFNSEDALQQHRRDAPAHRNLSPVDSFFARYVDFDYDPRNAPSDEMARLQRRYGWARNDAEASEAWDEYRQALVLEFEAWYGTDNNNLDVWRSLCRTLQVSPLPGTCAGCRQAVRGRYVNMIDLLHHRRSGTDYVQIFDTLDDLRKYTKEHHRYFPKETLERGALLENLLRHIFSRP